MVTTEDAPVEELSLKECWELLELEEFGRLAYRLVDQVHLVPVTMPLTRVRSFFGRRPATSSSAAALHSDVAFEIDWHDEPTAWSVVVRGGLGDGWRRTGAPGRVLPERTWVPTLRGDVVELLPTFVTRRRFSEANRPRPMRFGLRATGSGHRPPSRAAPGRPCWVGRDRARRCREPGRSWSRRRE